MNTNNFGIVTGRLTRDVKILPNTKGSRKALFTVAAANNFKSKDGTKKSQFIPLEAFIGADKKDNGVYDKMHEDDLVTVEYAVVNNNYTKTNEDGSETPVYGITLMANSVQLLESKAVTDARAAAKVAQGAQAAAPVEA